MTIKGIRGRLKAIQAMAGLDDHERAHSAQDKLWKDVLTSISCADHSEAAELAREALLVCDIEFQRWYA